MNKNKYKPELIFEFEKWAIAKGYDLWEKDGIYINVTIQIVFPAFIAGWRNGADYAFRD